MKAIFGPARNIAVAVPLVHLTSEAGKAAIEESGMLRGSQGIWAVPEHVKDESVESRVWRTWVSRSSVTDHVPIPEAALGHFSRPFVLGMWSGFKYLAENYFADAGRISLEDGRFHREGAWFGPRMSLYLPDILFWLIPVAVLALLHPDGFVHVWPF